MTMYESATISIDFEPSFAIVFMNGVLRFRARSEGDESFTDNVRVVLHLFEEKNTGLTDVLHVVSILQRFIRLGRFQRNSHAIKYDLG